MAFSSGICCLLMKLWCPSFKDCAKHPQVEEKGYVLYYTSQCPFNAKYIPTLEETAREGGECYE